MFQCWLFDLMEVSREVRRFYTESYDEYTENILMILPDPHVGQWFEL